MCSICPFMFSGTFQDNEGQDTCTECPAGYGCNSTSKSECVAGTFSAAGQMTCLTCASGTMNYWFSCCCSTPHLKVSCTLQPNGFVYFTDLQWKLLLQQHAVCSLSLQHITVSNDATQSLARLKLQTLISVCVYIVQIPTMSPLNCVFQIKVQQKL